ncbi:hypothetical protein [Vibrio phage P23]|nr:hypothetical protein [Vibrio phage P23]
MTLQQYEVKYLDELIDNWSGIDWDEYVRDCYQKYMDSMGEQKIAEWENSQ